ncbi:MAG: ABC-F family ATP-binding cassette domain-containing protein [Bacteriovoracia bacterium]
MNLLCTIQHLHLSFGGRQIFDDIGLQIHQNDRIGLVGLNGSGKSTLLKVIASLQTADISEPGFTYDKSSFLQKKQRQITYIPQNLNFSDKHTIENFLWDFFPSLGRIQKRLEEINQKLETANPQSNNFQKLLDEQQKLLTQASLEGTEQFVARYKAYLKKFNNYHPDKKLIEMSGGERRKVALALGLSSDAAIVLWDEPTNHLDMEAVEIFEQELNNASQGIILITHDRYLLDRTVNKIFHLNRGQLKSYQGNFTSYLEQLTTEQKEREKEVDRLQNIYRRELAWMRQGIKARGTRSKKRVETFHQIKGNINQLKDQYHQSANLQLGHSGRKTKQLFEIQNLFFKYDENSIPILKNINLVLGKKTKLGLLGPNGHGKTTLLRILLGEIKDFQADVFKKADDLEAYFFKQNREALDKTKTPWQEIGEGKETLNTPFGEVHISSYLQKFLFQSEDFHRPLDTFSGGEINRLQLAKFMKNSADLWIFDEPTNDLDIETLGLLEEELSSYQGAVIIVSHDRAFLENIVDHYWLLQDGSLENFADLPKAMKQWREKKVGNEISKAESLPPKEDVKSTGSSKPKTKPTYQQKRRWEIIDQEIEKAELKVEKLEQELADFDYQNNDSSQLSELNQKLITAQKELDSIYEEWNELDELFS